MNQINNRGTSLPHHRLFAYKKSLELLAAVRAAQIRDAKLRDEALRAAKGTCLNIAEGAGRVSRGDKARVVLQPLLGVARPIPPCCPRQRTLHVGIQNHGKDTINH